MFVVGSLYIVSLFSGLLGVILFGWVPVVKHCRNCLHSARWVFLLAALVAPLVCAARPAPAQEDNKYNVLKPDKQQKLFEIRLNPLCLKGKFDPGEEEAMVAYYTQYFFPCWTDPTFYPRQGDQLPILRKRLSLQLQLADRPAAKEVHNRLNAVTLDFMNKLANGNYSPAVRVNAMLMIGDLNAVEPAPPHNKRNRCRRPCPSC